MRVARSPAPAMKPKQLIGYAVIAFVLFFVIKDPERSRLCRK